MEKMGHKRTPILLVSCILIMLLVFYALFDFTFAWLFTYVEKESTGSTTLAGIEGTHSTTEEISITMPQANNVLSLTDKVLITNTGSTDALLRVFYTIYIDETAKQIATTSAISSLSINSAFVASDENIDNVYSGYYYYNSTLLANNQVNFLTSITPTSEIGGKVVKIKVMYELVNYAGGAYQLGQDLPWSNTPASWAFNYDYVTKLSESSITPKLDIKFSEISKIQLTAKTTSTEKNILFCQYNGAYIGLQSSTSWTFSQLSASASLTPSQFTNGDFNTIVFTINSCSATTDEYVAFVWDSTWSKEISYKQIKIWDTDGELRYNLIPQLITNGADVVSIGNLYDKVSGATLNMYKGGGTTLTSTTSSYDGFSDIICSYNYETYSDGYSLNASNGAEAVVVSDESHYGSKCIKVTNTKNVTDVTDFSVAKFGWLQFTPVVGYRYTISLWVKSDAPVGAMSYCMYNDNLYGCSSGLVFSKDGTQAISSRIDYYSSNEWTLISITTPTITDVSLISYCFEIPTGTEYTTYIDDLIVRAHL